MIIGKSVALGPILPGDFPSLFRWADDFDAAACNETYRPAVWKNQEEFWFNQGRDASRVFFAIRKPGTQPIIGYVQIFSIDPVHHSASLGLRIGDEACRNQGYGGEALKLAIDYCWNQLHLSRIGLTVFAGNDRAIRLYAARGFAIEGRLSRALFIAGAWTDVILMSLLHPSRLG